MDRRLSTTSWCREPPARDLRVARAWPISLAVHAMALAVLASVSVKVAREDAPPPGPLVFHPTPQPPRSAAPAARASTPAHRHPGRPRPVVADPLPVVRADDRVAEPEPDVLESPVGDLRLCLGCAAGPSGGGAPPYPELARRAHVEGKVIVECVIDERGRVRDVRVVSGHPLLARAAAEAVGAWIYTPTTLNGQAISVILNVTVTFGLGHH